MRIARDEIEMTANNVPSRDMENNFYIIFYDFSISFMAFMLRFVKSNIINVIKDALTAKDIELFFYVKHKSYCARHNNNNPGILMKLV